MPTGNKALAILSSFGMMYILFFSFKQVPIRSIVPLSGSGTCNEKAQNQGTGQKVFSFSVFGESYNGYWWGIPTQVVWIEKLFPGWLVRFYTNQPKKLRDLESRFPHLVFICDMRNLPESVRNLSESNPRVWRFLPLLDSQVDIANFRDTDSIVSRDRIKNRFVVLSISSGDLSRMGCSVRMARRPFQVHSCDERSSWTSVTHSCWDMGSQT